MKVLRVVACILAAGVLVAPMFSQAPAQVSISLQPRGNNFVVVVTPDTVTVNQGGVVRWVSQGDSADSIAIVFDDGGPFPTSGQPDNPSRGRYQKGVGQQIVTAGAADPGDWKYSVTWTTADGDAYEVDPVVSVRR
jgi:hypothetical protein